MPEFNIIDPELLEKKSWTEQEAVLIVDKVQHSTLFCIPFSAPLSLRQAAPPTYPAPFIFNRNLAPSIALDKGTIVPPLPLLSPFLKILNNFLHINKMNNLIFIKLFFFY